MMVLHHLPIQIILSQIATNSVVIILDDIMTANNFFLLAASLLKK